MPATYMKELAQYAWSDRGLITTPGRFEGEMMYLPHFWNTSMEGFCEWHRDKSVSMPIESADIQLFKNLIRYVDGYEKSQGLLVAIRRLKRKRRVALYQMSDGRVEEKR